MRFHALLPVRDEADIVGQCLRHCAAGVDRRRLVRALAPEGPADAPGRLGERHRRHAEERHRGDPEGTPVRLELDRGPGPPARALVRGARGDMVPERLDREFEEKFGERGDAVAFRADEAKVVEFLQRGYRDARPPTLADAEAALGAELTRRWITGSARDLLKHYFTSEGARVYMAMTVTESGPVALSDAQCAELWAAVRHWIGHHRC